MVNNKVHTLRINLYYSEDGYSETRQLLFHHKDSFKYIYDTFKKEYESLSNKRSFKIELTVYNCYGTPEKTLVKLSRDNEICLISYNKKLLPINVFNDFPQHQ